MANHELLYLVHIIQHFAFIFTELSNGLLFYFSSKLTSKKYGSYKYLMIAYSIFAMIYAVIEFSTQPIVHIKDSLFILYCNSFLKSHIFIATRLCEIYCSSFGFCISLLTTHFVYRYVAICRPGQLYKIEGKRLSYLFILPIMVGGFWFVGTAYFLKANAIKSEFIREEIHRVYEADSFNIGYIAVLYYYDDSKGNNIVSIRDLFGGLLLIYLMGFCIFLIVFCGLQTYRKMRQVSNMSKRTVELNNQLFKTLVIQTLVPLCTMFTPVGLLVIFPIFSINVGPLANITSITACLYPGVDALIAMIMIKDFREAIKNGNCKRRQKGVSSINKTEKNDRSSTNQI